MLYRVACRSHDCPFWQWKSTTLRSLEAALGYSRLYAAFPRDRLRLFHGSSRAALDELLARENRVTARLFRGVGGATEAPQAQPVWMSPATSPDDIRTYPCGGAPAASAVAVVAERRASEPEAALGGDEVLENRRVSLEQGGGGDYDEPYTFALPISVKQTLAWARLLARVRRGELER